ncbi:MULTISPECIES: c-type cytochrome biogenesis protein CcmI [Reinekea]|jgi:cytochrome c-type biogenesis protein CcmH|uniref:Cytochrome c heme lyase subunit CcmH n=1 Tax=Reinekea forsetii TaxID=1336806 RepID=A0A2K8KQX6_9GAMM|nr:MULTISPECIES: c-type cytochrome biogenesis protein CcmI [Reinekea]ATX77140.1 cytochrome c heme lyase subunit CcmH [Reinekea forsetii]
MLILTIWVIPVLVFVLFAVRQRSQKEQGVESVERSLSIHKEQLARLDQLRDSGELSDVEYQSFRLEEEKALLADAETDRSSRGQVSQMSWVWVPLFTLAIFGGAWLTYNKIGAYPAVQVKEQFAQLASDANLSPEQVSKTLNDYQQLLEKTPEDIEGWFRLARMQMDMEAYPEALLSLNKVLAQLRLVEHEAEDESTILAYIGQVQATLGASELSLAAFEESLSYFQNDTALGLAGRLSFDLGKNEKAIEYWTRLKLNNLDADSQVIDEFIAEAKDRLLAQGIDYAVDEPIRIVVRVNLPAAWEGLSKDAALFVYARPIGSRMPLAVKRLAIRAQNVTVMLSDSDAMGPMAGISSQDVVEVTARVSLTGIANAQPGDWGTDAVEVSLNQVETNVELTINMP